MLCLFNAVVLLDNDRSLKLPLYKQIKDNLISIYIGNQMKWHKHSGGTTLGHGRSNGLVKIAMTCAACSPTHL